MQKKHFQLPSKNKTYFTRSYLKAYVSFFWSWLRSICSSMIQIYSASSTPPNRDNTKQVQNTAVSPIIFAVPSYLLVEMQVY